MVVTPDHLFLTPAGKLKRADRLVPGQDFLVSAEGAPVAINEVSISKRKGGVHHIAIDKEFTGNVDGHLLISEGVVSGDFNLQIYARDLKAQYFADDHDNLPKVGSAHYEKLNRHLQSGAYKTFAVKDNAAAVAKPHKFYVHGQHVCAMPETAAKYLSELQQADVGAKADQLGFSEVGIGNSIVSYIIKLFQGFYPDIIYYHDIGNLDANGFAFEQYGKKMVVLAGGLTRIKGLGLQGLALILAHLTARLQKLEPHDDYGYTSVGMTDYYSAGVLKNVFFGDFYQGVYESGLKQIQDAIFAGIAKPEHEKYEDDPFQPSIDTRLDAIDAGDSAHFPPEELGGPAFGGLKVTAASAQGPHIRTNDLATADIDAQMAQAVYQQLQTHKVLDAQGFVSADYKLETDLAYLFQDKAEKMRQLLIEEVRYVLLHAGASIRLSFNIALNPKSAVDSPDYQLQPGAEILAARLSADSASDIVLTANLQRSVKYTLTVARYVNAANGSTLDTDHNSVKFSLA